jgi:hypothetical protein
MKVLNTLLILLIVGVLALGGFGVKQLVEACCGGTPSNLVVTTDGPVCTPDDVTVSANWDVSVPTDNYTTGWMIDVWYPGVPINGPSVSANTTVASNQTAAASWGDTYLVTNDTVGMYQYAVQAWSVAPPMGTQTTDVVSGNFDIFDCGEPDLKPGSCPNSFNRNKKGVVPLAITGNVDFDATLVSDVKMLGLTPVKTEIMDSAKPDGIEPGVDECEECLEYVNEIDLTPYADGIDDYVAYFDARAVSANAELSGADRGDCILVEITWMYDGVLDSFFDIIRIVK